VERAGTTRRVLLIEDYEDSAQALCVFLQARGHEVVTAGAGLEGIEKARSFAPDVILCDLGLPDIDGLAVARQIRSDEKLKDVWLVAVTAYYVPKLAFEAGFDEHVTKPADLERIAILIESEPPTREP
jgi:CheY-like chemotaxis protein